MILIVLLVAGFILLAEVCKRMCIWSYPTDFTYWICRPFWIPFSMKTGVIITFLETVLGAFLTCYSITTLFMT